MPANLSTQRGVSLVEVLVTMVIVAFGLLGLAAFQTKAQVGQVESYQRAQAAVLLQDMASRINGNANTADDYVTGTSAPLGIDDTADSDCAALASLAARDKCEWSAALKGASEIKGTAQVGGVQGARGCVVKVQAMNNAAGVCTPAVYQVTVAWQGLHPTKEPAQKCGTSTQYGGAAYRRAISTRVAVGLPACH
jgi:type IV pilus assembly protein PilV